MKISQNMKNSNIDSVANLENKIYEEQKLELDCKDIILYINKKIIFMGMDG